MNWDGADNIVSELARLNRLISDHPCFFDGAILTRLSAPDSPVYALRRDAPLTTVIHPDLNKPDLLLVLVNLDENTERTFSLNPKLFRELGNPTIDLLGQGKLTPATSDDGAMVFTLPCASAWCLGAYEKPAGLYGAAYRDSRSLAAWAMQALIQVMQPEMFGDTDAVALAATADSQPEKFLAAASELAGYGTLDFPGRRDKREGFFYALRDLMFRDKSAHNYMPVIVWTLLDVRRVTPVPPGHWLLVRDTARFHAVLNLNDGTPERHIGSVPVRGGHMACFPPRETAANAELILERQATTSPRVSASIRFLPPIPSSSSSFSSSDIVLLTNGIGGMARMCVDLGRVNSKYDCVLGANLDASVPVDRHVFVKRIRVWVNADGFLSPLNAKNLASFDAGPPATWQFVAHAGDGRTVEIELCAEMIEGKNTTVFYFRRPAAGRASGKQLPADADVRLTVRFDIEDRNFHWETKHNGGADCHFSTNCHNLPPDRSSRREEAHSLKPETDHASRITHHVGFAFTPASDRQLRVFADAGEYHPQPEWCENIPHPVEQSRGHVGSGDAYSPGWFELPLPKGASVTLVATADGWEFRSSPAKRDQSAHYSLNESQSRLTSAATIQKGDVFAEQLTRAAKQFVVRRDQGKTVIAGYPWFLNWGRDTLICARGFLAAGMVDDVKLLLLTFARFEEKGTLPNTIHGNDVSNRDTSDAPLWFALVCEELFNVGQASSLSRSGKMPATLCRAR